MEVDSRFEESLLRSLKLEDPWLSPKTWESIPSESGVSANQAVDSSSSRDCLYDISSVSVCKLVTLIFSSCRNFYSLMNWYWTSGYVICAVKLVLTCEFQVFYLCLVVYLWN